MNPPRVDNVEEHWGALKGPPEPSPRLVMWVDRVARGWRPNRRVRRMGYYTAAEFFGIWIWEYLHVLSPMLYPR